MDRPTGKPIDAPTGNFKARSQQDKYSVRKFGTIAVNASI